MPSPINTEFQLPATPAAVFGMLTDSGFVDEKIKLAKSGDFEITPGIAGPTVRATRTIDAGLPAMVQKFVGSQLSITEIQTWNASYFSADFELVVENAPVEIKGQIQLVGTSETTVKISGSVKVNVPIFGAAAEPQVVQAINQVLTEEEQLCRKWIAKKLMQSTELEFLTSPLGQQVIAEVDVQLDPILGVTNLRKKFNQLEPELVSQAITQAKLKAKVAQHGFPTHFLLTDDGVQQATRPAVAKFRAELLQEKFGKLNIVDLTSGLGTDSYFLALAGHKVTAVEIDPAVARIASHNLAPLNIEVINISAEDYQIPPGTDLVFLDPARRDPNAPKNSSGQTKRVMDPSKWSPNWEFIKELTKTFKVMAKVAPGIDDALLEDFDAYWISCDGDLVETLVISPGSSNKYAVLITSGVAEIIQGGQQSEVAKLGDYLVVPNSALIRASALNFLVEELSAGLVNEHIAWLTSSDKTAVTKFIGNPAASCFEILASHKFNEKELATYVQGVAPDALTIMTRGVDLDPDQLRKKLLRKPTKGGRELVLAIYRDDKGTQVLSCRRLSKLD